MLGFPLRARVSKYYFVPICRAKASKYNIGVICIEGWLHQLFIRQFSVPLKFIILMLASNKLLHLFFCFIIIFIFYFLFFIFFSLL